MGRIQGVTAAAALAGALTAAFAAGPAAAQGAAVAAVPSASGAAAAEDSRRWTFQLEWGPVKLADVQIAVSESPAGDVELTGTGRSVGLAAMIADFEIEQRASYGADGVRRYRTVSRFDDRSVRREVRWDGPVAAGALPSAEVASSEPEVTTPIPPEELAGTVDPAFPVWDVMRKVEAGEGCAGTWRVYDGVRRFDLTLEDQGIEVLEADRDWTWGGEALRCRLYFRRVGGFPVDPERPVRDESEFERLLYVARTPEGALPVRLRVQWPLGYATGRIDLR